MKKQQKKKLRYTFYNESPAVSAFFYISFLFFIVSCVFPRAASLLLHAPSRAGTPSAFNFAYPLHYLRMILHVFGTACVPGADAFPLTSETAARAAFSFCALFIFGPPVEQRFGSLSFILMSAVCSAVSGAVNAAVSPAPASGSAGILFMLVSLCLFSVYPKRKTPVTILLASAVTIAFTVFAVYAVHPLLLAVYASGALCGMLFCFAVSVPEKAVSKKNTLKTPLN